MTSLRELSYEQVVSRLRRFGLRFYRRGKGSHELWVRDEDGLVIPVPRHRGNLSAKAPYVPLSASLG